MTSIRHALRSLSHAPGFCLLAVLTMALGVAATTALFSVVYAVILEPLAFPQPERVVAVQTAWPNEGKVVPRITGGDFVDLRAAAHAFSALSVYGGGEMGVRLRDRARFTHVFAVDPSFFKVLGAKPVIGRMPANNDAGQAAIVTASFARASFGSISAALHERVTVDNKPYSVIGVVPDAQSFPEKAEVWISSPVDPDNLNRTSFNYRAIGRLRAGVSRTQAEAELAALGGRMAAAHPGSNQGKTFRAIPLQEQLVAPVRPTLWFLFGAAGLLLLVACANVANLMLAWAAGRTRDIAIRLSLGSSASQISRLLLLEGALLGAGAALVGLAFSFAALRALFPLLPASLPHAEGALRPHLWVLLFALGVSVLTVLVCSLLPALHLRRANLAEILKRSAARGFVGGADRSRNSIVVAQIALCCILCVGAALLSRSLLALLQEPLGFRPEGVLVMYADSPATGMPQHMAAIRTFESALEDIRHTPRVQSAAAAMGLPTGQYGSNGSYLVEGVHIQAGQDPFKLNWPRTLPWARFALASSQYFATIGMHLVAGRDFTLRDQYDVPFSAIINESLARQSFGRMDPIGQKLYCGLDSPKPMTIIGVVSDVRQNSPGAKPEPEIYMPFQQHPFFANELQVAVRTAGDPTALAAGLRKRMHQLAPFTATRFTTLNEMVQDSIAAPRFRAALAGAFALVAITLALIGVYGIMSYYVTERRSEMAVRMALGATPRAIVKMVSSRALSLGLLGLAIGTSAAIALSHIAESLLYGVRALDPLTYCLGAAAVLLVVVMAGLLPAARASRVDPAAALRSN